MKSLQQLLPFTLLVLFLQIHGNSAEINKEVMLPGQLEIVQEFDKLLNSMVNNKTGLFDDVGSIDVAIWKRFKSNGTLKPLYLKAFGKSQIIPVIDKLDTVNIAKPSIGLKKIAKDELSKTAPWDKMVPAQDDDNSRNQYRIASITKSFMGYIANYLVQNHNLNLDTKISPRYLNLSTLGKSHKWDTALEKDGYSPGSPNSSVFINLITFRHLLTHTSGLSRESRKGNDSSYGSSRTSTPACPPKEDQSQGSITCSNSTDLNWRPWTQAILRYMMPACGYSKYHEKSTKYPTCNPGQYYHYSNAGFSILGLAIDNFIKQELNSTLEEFFKKVIVHQGLKDTALSWCYFNESQRSQTTHGCYGGENRSKCDAARALTDYSDRGIKTPPGGIWSTTTDLAKFMLDMLHNNSKIYKALTDNDDTFLGKVDYDNHSEEDSSHMPLSVFKYGHGFYVADNYTCSTGNQTGLYGSWGTVPGFTSYVITTKDPGSGPTVSDQYTVVMVRSYNYNKRLNLGNQARRLAWRLLNPNLEKESLKCPVTVCDKYCQGDKVIQDPVTPTSVPMTTESSRNTTASKLTTTPSSSATGVTFNHALLLFLSTSLLFTLV